MADGAQEPAPERQPRAPSLLDAVLPVVVLICLIALTIELFGIDATNGPLQVALLLSASFAALMALKNGYTAAAVLRPVVTRAKSRGQLILATNAAGSDST